MSLPPEAPAELEVVEPEVETPKAKAPKADAEDAPKRRRKAPARKTEDTIEAAE